MFRGEPGNARLESLDPIRAKVRIGYPRTTTVHAQDAKGVAAIVGKKTSRAWAGRTRNARTKLKPETEKGARASMPGKAGGGEMGCKTEAHKHRQVVFPGLR